MFPAARNSVLRTARSQLRQSQPIAVPQYSAFARLASTLAVLEQKDGKLNPASLSAITAGTKLGGSITAFLAGSGVKSVADEAAKAKGIEKIIYVDNGAYDKVSSSQWLYRLSRLMYRDRVFLRTSRPSWLRTSRKVDTRTLLQDSQHSERT